MYAYIVACGSGESVLGVWMEYRAGEYGRGCDGRYDDRGEYDGCEDWGHGETHRDEAVVHQFRLVMLVTGRLTEVTSYPSPSEHDQRASHQQTLQTSNTLINIVY